MRTKIAIYDVFARRPFEGNQAAVINKGRGRLSDKQFLTLARELSLAETVILSRRGNDLVFRFANTDRILKACGHGTLAGIAHHVLWGTPRENKKKKEWRGRYRIGSAVAEWRLSPVTSSKTVHSGLEIAVAWPLRPRLVTSIPVHSVYRALGLRQPYRNLNLPLCIYDSGNLNALVPVRTLSELKRATPNGPLLKRLFAKYGLTDLHMYCLLQCDPANRKVRLHCRNLFPYGLFEETATGTASVSLATALIDHLPKLRTYDQPIEFLFEQGIGKRRGIISVQWLPKVRRGNPTIWLRGRVFCAIRGDLLSTLEKRAYVT